jgi:hypothetical protein
VLLLVLSQITVLNRQISQLNLDMGTVQNSEILFSQLDRSSFCSVQLDLSMNAISDQNHQGNHHYKAKRTWIKA